MTIRSMTLALAAFVFGVGAAPEPSPTAGRYLFVWAGSATGAPRTAPSNALLVIDADRTSATYGRLVASTRSDAPSLRVHHTEYTMPASGILFANDHDAGRTWRIDLRDPRRPVMLGSFGNVRGFAMPHSFVRTPSGTVLATFMHSTAQGYHGDHSQGTRPEWITGGLVEMDDEGRVLRVASNSDPLFQGELLSPYGLIVLPDIDRIISTNSAMNPVNGPGSTIQLWRLSTLELLETTRLDPGPTGLGHVDPEEPRLGPDGSVYIQTLSCSLQRVTGLTGDRLEARAVYRFPGGGCGVPTIAGRWLIQSVPYLNGLVVLDLSSPEAPVEVSRVQLPGNFYAHWTGWDSATDRVVVTGSSRVYLFDLNRQTGRLTLDRRFTDGQGAPGFDLAKAGWPQHREGRYVPHGAVFSR